MFCLIWVTLYKIQQSQSLMQNITVQSRTHQDQKTSHIHTPHTIINKKGTKYLLFSKPKPKIFSQQHISSIHQTMPSAIKCKKSAFCYSFNQVCPKFEAQESINKYKQQSTLCFDNRVVTSSNNTLLNMLKQDRMASAKKKQYNCVSINSQQTNSSIKKLFFDKNQYTCKFNQLPLKVTSSQIFSTSSASLHTNIQTNKQSQLKPKKHLQDAKSIISREVSSQSRQLNIDQSQLVERKLDIFDFVTPIEESRCCNMSKAVDKRYNSLVTFKIFTENKLDCYFRQAKIMQVLQQLQANMFIRAKQTLIQKVDSQNKIIVLFQPFHTTLSEFVRKIDNPNERNKFLELIKLQIISMIQNLVQKGIYLDQNLQLEDFVESEGAWKIRCLCKFKLVSASQTKKVKMGQVVPYVWLE